jgi:hypothetical protein
MEILQMRIAWSKAFLRGLVALFGALAISGGAFAVAMSPDALVTDTVREVQQIIRQDLALQTGDTRRRSIWWRRRSCRISISIA